MVDKVAKGAGISGAERERVTNTLRKQYSKGREPARARRADRPLHGSPPQLPAVTGA
jgi:hypothetical protein